MFRLTQTIINIVNLAKHRLRAP